MLSLRLCTRRAALQHAARSWIRGNGCGQVSRQLAQLRPACRRQPRAKNDIMTMRRSFQTSGRRSAPIPLAILAMVSWRAPAALLTRIIRRYLWPRLKPETRAVVKRVLIACGLGSYVGVAILAAVHTDVHNGRRRIMWVSDEEMKFLDTAARENVMENAGNNPVLLPSKHHLYRRVSSVMVQLIKANPCAQDIQWELAVVQSPIRNAVSFPGGTVVVFTGILDLIKDRNDLAVLLGHEMSHTILQHQAETVSEQKVVNLMSLPFTIAVNAFTGIGFSSLVYLTETWFSEVMLTKPYSRARESEADMAGMEMAAKACFNMQNAPDFFSRISQDTSDDMEWLSTHPSGSHRKQLLTERLAEVMELTREECADYMKWFQRKVLERPTSEEQRKISHSEQRAARAATANATSASDQQQTPVKPMAAAAVSGATGNTSASIAAAAAPTNTGIEDTVIEALAPVIPPAAKLLDSWRAKISPSQLTSSSADTGNKK